MATISSILRLKRRVTGAAGAPTGLKTAEPAMNMADNVLYIGYGDDASGNATSVVPIGGKGAFVSLAADDQTIAGTKTFSTSPVAPTPTAGDNSTKVATTAFVMNAVGTGSTGAMVYQGAWNASTNSPALATGVGTKGHYYKVSTAGATSIDGVTDWKVGDMIVYNGTAWDKFDHTDQVTSVAGQTGAVTLTKSDVGLANVDNTSDAGKPVSTAQQTALNLKANLASPTFTGTVSGIDKTMVGLANVDNTSDASKPVSTATATALATKVGSGDIIDGGSY